MTLKEALLSHKKFKRPQWDYWSCYYAPGTGPYKNLVVCSYFVIYQEPEDMFSTSMDMYGEEVLAEDYILEE